MTKIVVEEDCGNAPKKIQIRDLNIAFAKGESDAVLDYLTDDVVWNYVGDTRLEGKAAVADALQKEERTPKAEMAIFTIMTHGNVGGANGTMTLENGKTHSFSHVYTFSSAGKQAKIKEIMSYVIKG